MEKDIHTKMPTNVLMNNFVTCFVLMNNFITCFAGLSYFPLDPYANYPELK